MILKSKYRFEMKQWKALQLFISSNICPTAIRNRDSQRLNKRNQFVFLVHHTISLAIPGGGIFGTNPNRVDSSMMI